MRRVSIAIAVCFVLALAISVVGQARDLDAIMKEIGGIWGTQQAPGMGAALTGATPDYAKISADAAKLQSLFTEAAGQFSKLKIAEAEGIAKSASEAAGALAKEAKTGKIGDAKASKTAIGQCGACHQKFRESDGAGGFKLKAQ